LSREADPTELLTASSALYADGGTDPVNAAPALHLAGMLHRAVHDADGYLPFSRFMEMVLYEPGFGYYSGEQTRFGADGDFITAAEHSNLYAESIALQVAEVLDGFGGEGEILEFGAGSGRFAGDLLQALGKRSSVPKQYTIMEVSAELKACQRRVLTSYVDQGIVRWSSAMPAAGFVGVVIANEVLDAMPVTRFQKLRSGQFAELGVGARSRDFIWRTRLAGPQLSDELMEIERSLGMALPDGYVSEVNLLQSPWIGSVSDMLKRGLVLICDYGYTRREYYHCDRNNGTLICHHRHRVNYNPFINIGLQDISASVDFSAVAHAARRHQLQVSGYANQAQFLLSCGLDRILSELQTEAPEQYLEFAAQAKMLTLPSEMGERFKVMALTRDIKTPLCGFELQDLCGRL